MGFQNAVIAADRGLYLPETWTADRERCRAAGVPDEVGFATKPRLAMAMLELWGARSRAWVADLR